MSRPTVLFARLPCAPLRAARPADTRGGSSGPLGSGYHRWGERYPALVRSAWSRMGAMQHGQVALKRSRRRLQRGRERARCAARCAVHARQRAAGDLTPPAPRSCLRCWRSRSRRQRSSRGGASARAATCWTLPATSRPMSTRSTWAASCAARATSGCAPIGRAYGASRRWRARPGRACAPATQGQRARDRAAWLPGH